jgi:hydroxyacylglutathione hydrolase
MFLETVRSPELGHFSYILGDGAAAAVIDPRRDCEVYMDIADRQGAKITHIFETHRNEDYLTGSCELAERTGAAVYHGPETAFGYGRSVAEGDRFALGDAELSVLFTPGHTFDSISLVLRDTGFGELPIGVFTGDALFIGDVGRTDFFPDRAEEVAGLLHDSLFGKLLPLGDQTLLYPAHGSGSICGSGMASRDFSTIGYERRTNPALQKADRDAFVRMKLAETHYYPPYFRRMEELNQAGQPILGVLPRPQPLTAAEVAEAREREAVLLDIRSAEACSGAVVPGSLVIPVGMLSGFAGWFLPYDREIVLIAAGFADLDAAVRQLVRLGYDRVAGFLDEGLHSWEISGRDYRTIPAVSAHALARRLESGESFTLLDVRSEDEVASGKLPASTHVYVGEVPARLDAIPRDRPITAFCGSGQRAIIAASVLKQNGFEDVEVCLGSMAACRAVGCPIEPGAEAA